MVKMYVKIEVIFVTIFRTLDGDAAQSRLILNGKPTSRAHHVIPHDLIPTDRN